MPLEKQGLSRTFLIIEEDESLEVFDNLNILAYFTLTIKVINVEEGFSKTRVKKLTGYKNSKEKLIPIILLGQLGKNDNHKNKITGEELMIFVNQIVKEGQSKLSGTGIMVECTNNSKLIDFYEKHDYRLIDKEYEDDELIQFVKIFNRKDIIEKDKD